jgi:hypothetical protein
MGKDTHYSPINPLLETANIQVLTHGLPCYNQRFPLSFSPTYDDGYCTAPLAKACRVEKTWGGIHTV